jgi:hypothetical protein
MQFQTVNRTDTEKGFGVCKNVSGGVISGNYPVCLATTSGSNDGHQVVLPATGAIQTFIGFMDEDAADVQDGCRYQAYGYRDSVRIFATGTSGTNAVGIALGPGAGSAGINSTGVKETFGPVIAMEAIGAAVNSPGGYAKAFIRLM